MNIFDSLMLHSYCPQCGRPCYWLFNRLCFTCYCRGQVSTHDVSTEDIIPAPEPEPEPVPALMPPAQEITPIRAYRVYLGICERIAKHQVSCIQCDILSEQNMMCPDQSAMWLGRHFWLARSEESEKTV